jgi:hypothetical protein
LTSTRRSCSRPWRTVRRSFPRPWRMASVDTVTEPTSTQRISLSHLYVGRSDHIRGAVRPGSPCLPARNQQTPVR